eukprot:3934545-Rhodomonas_salina.2
MRQAAEQEERWRARGSEGGRRRGREKAREGGRKRGGRDLDGGVVEGLCVVAEVVGDHVPRRVGPVQPPEQGERERGGGVGSEVADEADSAALALLPEPVRHLLAPPHTPHTPQHTHTHTHPRLCARCTRCAHSEVCLCRVH